MTDISLSRISRPQRDRAAETDVLTKLEGLEAHTDPAVQEAVADAKSLIAELGEMVEASPEYVVVNGRQITEADMHTVNETLAVGGGVGGSLTEVAFALLRAEVDAQQTEFPNRILFREDEQP